MSVAPSCPVLVILEDDAFRRALIATLDARNFTVTFASDGDEAIQAMQSRPNAFRVILAGVNLTTGRGTKAVEYLRDHRDTHACALIIVGDPDPKLRTFAPWADETLMKPVDAEYVAKRAQVYCSSNC